MLPRTSLRLVGCLAILAATLGLGCGRRPSVSEFRPQASTSGAPRALGARHAIGDRAEASDFAMTVSALRECPLEYLKPGNVVLGLEVAIEGRVEREVQVNPFYGELTDANGFAYRPSFKGCEPRLNNVRLEEGERASGFINFEVPTQATRLVLTYEPATTGGDVQRLVFDLGR